MPKDLDDDLEDEDFDDEEASSPLARASSSGGGRYAQVKAAMEARRSPPKGVSARKWLSDPKNLGWASKRRMVSKIANKANPASKNTANVFTIGGKRYALTDLYRSPLTERVRDLKSKTKAKSLDWWDANQKTVIVAAVATVAGYIIYSHWKNSQLEAALDQARAPHALPPHPIPKPKTPVKPAVAPPAHHTSGEYGDTSLWDWPDYGYELVPTPATPIVTSGYFAGSPRALYPTTDGNR